MAALSLVVLGVLAAAEGTVDPARLAADRLAVLPIVIDGPNGNARISSVFNDVIAAAELRPRLRVIAWEEFVALEEGLGARVLDCGSDTRCIAARLRPFNARLGLVVVADFASRPPALSLQLLDTEGTQLIEESTVDLPASGPISQSVTAKAGELLERAGYGRAGRVIVEVDPPRARLVLGANVDPDLGTSNRFTVAPGEHTISAALDGYAPGRVVASVASGGETRVQLALVKETNLLESPWLWVGVAVVAIGVTSTALVLTREDRTCLCLVIDGQGCTCPP